MLIGEVAKAAQVSRDTLRYYEELGLIASTRRRNNNYKEYPPKILEDLHFIQRAKGLGFTLQEIQTLIGVFRSNRQPCAELASLLEEKLADIQRKRQELVAMETLVQEQLHKLYDNIAQLNQQTGS